jgi:hypothetical protein
MGSDDELKKLRGNSKESALTCWVFSRLFSRDEADKLDYMREASLEELFLKEDESTLTLNARKHAFSFVFKVLEKRENKLTKFCDKKDYLILIGSYKNLLATTLSYEILAFF